MTSQLSSSQLNGPTRKHFVYCFLLIALAANVLGQTVTTQTQETAAARSSEMKLYPTDTIQWKDGPASLPAGSRIAVLEGNPEKEGFFTMRLWFPDGFRVQPHWHPKVEHVTVISGILNLGMGEKFDQAATQALPAGTFGFWPAEMRHFAWAKGETIIQLHGFGPWSIVYVNSADDPRKSKQ